MDSFKVLAVFSALIIAVVAVVAYMGLVGSQLNYVCPDGSVVEDSSKCRLENFTTKYVCPDGTEADYASLCAKQYVCWDKEVVTNLNLCGVKPPTEQDDSKDYWLEEAMPFQIIEYRIAKSTLFMTLKNAGENKVEYVELRFNGRPVRLGFMNTTFWSTEAKTASGSMETRCGNPGKNYSYNLSITYNDLDNDLTGLKQVGEMPLVGKCTQQPNAVLSVSCYGAGKETSGTISLQNAGVDSAPTNSINVKLGTKVHMLQHPPLAAGDTMQLTEKTFDTPLTSGVQGEVWVTGGASVLFVCMG